jgi:hypothetical protein
MDLTQLAELKNKLVSATEYIKVWEFFLDQFGENPDFIALGDRVRHPFLEAVLSRVAHQLFKSDIDWDNVFLTSLPEHQFIHGGGPVKGGLINVMYFDDIHTGLMCAMMPTKMGEMKFVRFSGRKLPGSADPSLN